MASRYYYSFPPITSVNVGDIHGFNEDIIDVISQQHVSEIQYPVVTLEKHGQHFYDIRDLIQWVKTSHQNTFPHNRQRIHWQNDLDVAEWDNRPVDYVDKTRTYLEAARAYAPLWSMNEGLSREVRERDESLHWMRYKEFREDLARMSYQTINQDCPFSALDMAEYLSCYWTAHPAI